MTTDIRRTCRTLGFAITLLGTSSLASAQFMDDFESYAAGTALEGQGGWQGWDGVTTTNTQVSNSQAYTGSNSASITLGSDSVHLVPGATSGQWIVSSYCYLPSASTGVFDWILMNDYNNLGPYEWGCWYELDATTGQVNVNAGGVVSVPAIFDAWVELRVEVDLDADSATAYYNGNLVTTWIWTTGWNGTFNFPATAIEAFDLYATPTATGECFFDDVQAAPVVVISPGQGYCFGDGTGANCPCSAFGATGAGCANTTGSGATLTGSGSASVSSDSFQLDIAGVPGSKPGLILRGDNQVAVPAGDGILCTAGGSQRSHVQVTVAGATSFTDFNGAGFGAVANLGTPTNFQFWYRDPSNLCSGGGFNFTNGWTVNYLP